MKRLVAIACALALALSLAAPDARGVEMARGLVFADQDGDGRRGAGEPGLPDVRVSNGREIAVTDGDGRWELPVRGDCVLFVIKPRGWAPPLDDQNLPRFHHVHCPAGSPALRFAGVAPTGPLPASVDFPLRRQQEPDRFRAVLFGDTQPRDQKEIDYLAHDIIEEVAGVNAAFGVTLGDVMFDDLSLFGSLNAAVARVGIPWRNVLGNHDQNYDSPDDARADETFTRVYGPPYYSFDWGPVHFVVLDDVYWRGRVADEDAYAGGNYTAGLGADQLAFLGRDLALCPPDQLVVLFMHIPLTAPWVEADREALFRLLEARPRCLSVSAHYHVMAHVFLGAEDGWRGAAPHHHFINATTCGSWWSGAPDELGIPHTTMRDGAPNGWTLATFGADGYRLAFKAARRPADHQMSIFAPEVVARAGADTTEVLANVFAGSELSRVEMRLAGGEWRPMEREEREDPYYAAMKALEEGDTPPPGLRLPRAGKSPHIWRGLLPADPPAGTWAIEVRETDMFGQVHQGRRLVRIE